MNKQPLKALLIIALLSASFSCQAKFPGLLSRFQLGYSFLSNSADYKTKDDLPSYKMNTSASWGFTAGTYVPLTRLGSSGSLALGIDYMYNLMTWKSNIKVPDVGEFLFEGTTAQMALPIGLDFKFGSDALQLRTPRMCGTVGAGVYPSYALTTITGSPLTIDPTFAVAPYIKAEIGIFAGICMKVRMIYAIGDLNYMDYKKTEEFMGVTSTETAKLTGKSNMAISLLIMPFSYKWSTENWWNTY